MIASGAGTIASGARATATIAIATAFVLALPVGAMGQTSPPGSADTRDPTWARASGTILTLFPAGEVFPPYVADPHRPVNAILFRFYSNTELPGTTAQRTTLSGGGRFGMLRIDTAGAGGRAWQISLDAGIDALFDSEYSDSALGWDGNYGITVTTGSRGPWALKFAVLHVSAHLGDEYEERMNRPRIDYTREEVAVGVAWRPARGWRFYGEGARSFLGKTDGQEPWRAQAGVEFETPPVLWGGRFAWYVAGDAGAMQERGWSIDPAIQGGIVTRSRGRAYRMMIEYYKGRPPVTEFFKSTETSVTIGLRIDL